MRSVVKPFVQVATERHITIRPFVARMWRLRLKRETNAINGSLIWKSSFFSLSGLFFLRPFKDLVLRPVFGRKYPHVKDCVAFSYYGHAVSFVAPYRQIETSNRVPDRLARERPGIHHLPLVNSEKCSCFAMLPRTTPGEHDCPAFCARQVHGCVRIF